MADTFTETTSESWFSRIIGSIKSVLFGLALFVISFPVLFWNEGRAVRTAKSLEEGAGVVVSIPATAVGAGNEGKLVHLSGEATTTDTLADDAFGVKVTAIKLERNVEMFQWEEESRSEKKKKLGGGEETVTTYEYKKTWSSHRIDSSDFKKPEGHENPSSFPLEAKSLVAGKVTLGAFTLSEDIVGRIDREENLPVDTGSLPADKKDRVIAAGDGYFMGRNAASPEIGDVRIDWKVVRPATVSLVARQVKDTFEPYQAQAGDAILLLKYGTLSADAMFQAAQKENTIFTWILRFVGFFMMFLGLTMIFRPITVFADVVPIVGTLLGAGLAVFAGLTAAVLSLLTIAVSWIFFRPVLAISLIVVAVGALAWLIRIGLARRRARAEASTVRGAA